MAFYQSQGKGALSNFYSSFFHALCNVIDQGHCNHVQFFQRVPYQCCCNMQSGQFPNTSTTNLALLTSSKYMQATCLSFEFKTIKNNLLHLEVNYPYDHMHIHIHIHILCICAPHCLEVSLSMKQTLTSLQVIMSKHLSFQSSEAFQFAS